MNRLFIWAAVCLLTPPVEGGLIGFWNFSETGGSIAHDSSGSGTNGSLTANGAAFNPGAGPNGGGAINLSTGFVDMGNNFAFSGTQAFSIQAWIRTTATGSGTVMTRHYSNNQDGYILGINNFDSFCLNSSYNNKAAVLAGDGGNGCNLNGPAISVTPPSMVVVNDGAWHQLLVAFSGGTESLYVDGAFQGSATGVNISSCPTVDFIVGGYNVGGSGPCGIGTPTNGFTGLISDVAVWNEALTPAQVLTAFRNPGNPGLTEAIQPTILSGGIVPVYSSSTTIQPGEWVSIYGSNLSSATAIWTGNFPTSLGGTSVTINGKSAYLWVVSPGQINLQAPIDTATGPVPVVVTTGNGSVTSTVTLAQFAPSFLLLDSRHVTAIILRSDGSGAYGGGTYDIAGPTGTSLGYPTVAAKAGDSVVLFGVGFGPTSPAVLAGQAFSGSAATTNTVKVLVNNVNVIPSFAGLSSAGLYQINLTLPVGLGTGDVPLVASVGGAQTPSNVMISLQ